MIKCKRCGDWRNLYRAPIMWLLRPFFKTFATGQACSECGKVLWGCEPEMEPAHKSADRAIKRAKYGVLK